MSHCIRSLASFAALVAFCCINSICVATLEQNKTIVNVDVYYESLCPDSIYFITKELAPSYKDLKDFLSVQFVPFGKATWTISENSQVEFMCQHGPNECQGNRAQACALNEIEQTLSAEDQQQQKAVDVVNCVMSSSDPTFAVPQCLEKLGFRADSIHRIVSCSNNNVGNELLIANGEKTKAAESPLLFIPTIFVDGEKSAAAFGNFKNVICKKIPDGQKPAACITSS